MDKPCSRWFTIEKAQGYWAIQGFSYKKGRFGQGRVQEVRGGTRVYECRYWIGDARNLNENKKGDFRVRSESCADSDRVYRGIWGFMYSWRGVLGNNAIQVAHWWRRIACWPELSLHHPADPTIQSPSQVLLLVHIPLRDVCSSPGI